MTGQPEPKSGDRLDKARGIMVYPRLPIVDALTQMIVSRPECIGEWGRQCLENWDKTKRPSLALFEEYLQRATNSEQPLLSDDLQYSQWIVSAGDRFQGSKDRQTQQQHGLIRKVWSNGAI